MMTLLPHTLDRTVVIRAPRDTVFRYFTDDVRWAAWWGAGSTIDARPGGQLYIRFPNGVEASGEILEISSPTRIVFTYGFASGQPIPPGSSRVTIELESTDVGTHLRLTHEFAETAARDHHVQGWRYQLSLFANVVANEVNAGAADAVDGWFRAWTIADSRDRAAALAKAVAPDVQFRDRFSTIDSIDDLVSQIGAAQQFMPGLRLQRKGGIRHCQGTILADWVARTSEGQEQTSGTNVFTLAPDGRISSVVGFWN
jgi:uncharacterized protein YndB with AHSA1/START domain